MTTPAEAPPASGFAPLVPELDVTDLARSLDFWTRVLGFRIAYQRPAQGFAYLEREGPGALTVQVMLCRYNGGWAVAPLEHPLGRGINFQIETRGLAPILAALEDEGWPLFRPVAEAWYRAGTLEAGQRQLLVQDPDGYLLRFIESLGTRPAPAGAIAEAS
ncbi:VOC family protein [Roseomonas sp. M0104]|uniref:Bleomycin resistance protein n=1 Tax=Teichococcus coralli TaxID=2545983 RepID=A0A845BJP6_9PROT|nr:VOC family protein [Pseudoroseomonas coralli]MXP65517.1 VOC family protein [Pseudoroseomonas coralli]